MLSERVHHHTLLAALDAFQDGAGVSAEGLAERPTPNHHARQVLAHRDRQRVEALRDDRRRLAEPTWSGVVTDQCVEGPVATLVAQGLPEVLLAGVAQGVPVGTADHAGEALVVVSLGIHAEGDVPEPRGENVPSNGSDDHD